MISPAVLAACAESPPPPPNNPEPMPIATGGSDDPTPKGTPDVAMSDSGAPAPADSVVRPRTPVGTPPQMPTRGFSGAARARV